VWTKNAFLATIKSPLHAHCRRLLRPPAPPLPNWFISGTVYEAGTGIPDVEVVISGSGTATTDLTGFYSFLIQQGYTGSAFPLPFLGTFDPIQRNYVNVGTDVPNQDYTFYPTPPGLIQVTPIPLTFTGDTPIGSSGTACWDVSNIGGLPFSGSVTVAGSFAVIGNGSYYLAPNDDAHVCVAYTPVASGTNAGSFSWTDTATGIFTGGGGTSSPVLATGTLPLCPVVSSHPTISIGVDNRQGVSHPLTRTVWTSDGGILKVISTASNTLIQSIDLSVALFNTELIYDTVNDQIVATDQRGHLIFINPYTYAVSGVVLPGGNGPGSPPRNGFCFDSINGFAVIVTPSINLNITVVNCLTQATLYTHSFGTTGGVADYNPLIAKVMIGRGVNDPHPYWFFDTLTHALTVSTLNLSASRFRYIPELQVLVVQTYDLSTSPTAVYIVDAATDTIITQVLKASDNTSVTFNMLYCAYDSCSGLLYLGGDTSNLWTINPNNSWKATRVSIDAVDGIWFDPYSNLIYGAGPATNAIKTY
jgi:hypothetical protein